MNHVHTKKRHKPNDARWPADRRRPPRQVPPARGAQRADGAEPRDPQAFRLNLIRMFFELILEASLTAAESDIADPVIVIADPQSDAIAAAMLEGNRLTVVAVGASDLIRTGGAHLGEAVVADLRSVQPGTTFVLCLADGGATCGYVVENPVNHQLGFTTDPPGTEPASVIPMTPPRVGPLASPSQVMGWSIPPESFDRLQTKAVRPNVEALAKIAKDGGVAVVVFEPGHVAMDTAKALGWDGRSPVFSLPHASYLNFLAFDRAVAAWLLRRDADVCRVIVLIQEELLFMNYSRSHGLWIEPGPTATDGLN